MAHKVASVQTLFEDSMDLHNDLVVGGKEYSAATIIKDLDDGIANFKENWGGKDAGTQINNIIAVRNGMVVVSNSLDMLAGESSKVASNYREIQNSNGAGLEQFTALNAEAKSTIGEYSDDRDTIEIKPDVTTGMIKINTAKTEIDAFITRTKEACNRIMENWSEGDANRENAKQAIDEFLAKADQYKEVLNQASTSADTAIKNYNM